MPLTQSKISPLVLIIDDDFDIRETLTEILQDEGYNVIGAAHGGEGLVALRSGAKPDLILLDLMMPIMDGFQFRAEQKKDPQLNAIPTVVITAGSAERINDIAPDAVLLKPLDLEKLLYTIDQIL